MFKSFLTRLRTARGEAVLDDTSIHKSSGPVETVLIVVIDVSPALLAEIMAATKARFGKSHKIVYVTDDNDFMAFREAHVAFEYLPPLAHQHRHASDMPWRSYQRQRWDRLLAKWRPKLILSYGTNINAFLDAAPGQPAAGPAS